MRKSPLGETIAVSVIITRQGSIATIRVRTRVPKLQTQNILEDSTNPKVAVDVRDSGHHVVGASVYAQRF